MPRKTQMRPSNIREFKAIAQRLFRGVTWVAPRLQGPNSMFLTAKVTSGFNRVQTYELLYWPNRTDNAYELNVFGYGRRAGCLVTIDADDPRDLLKSLRCEADTRIQSGHDLLHAHGYLINKKENGE